MTKEILLLFIHWVIPTLLPDEAPIKAVNELNDDIEEDSPSGSATDDDDTNDPEHVSVLKKDRVADQYDDWLPLTPSHCAEEKHFYQLYETPEKTNFSLPIRPHFDKTEHLHSLAKLKLDDDSPEAEDDFSDEKDASSGTLSADNLSVDARACALPKRKHKKGKEKSKKHGHSDHKHDVPEKQRSKHGDHGKKSSETPTKNDIDEFIRKLAIQHSQSSRSPEIKFFDAAIVYDKNDYDEALGLKNEIWAMVRRELGEDLKIELFDSEEFAQSKILVVEDVLNRCSVILVYLTENFTSPELQFFVEEAIGLSRLGLEGASSSFERSPNAKQWAVKPVHTQPSKSRRYKTPVGFITVNGIDWFDRRSAHTKGQIISLMRQAIAQRKQRSAEANTTKTYNEYFGSSAQPPTFGPPFNQQVFHKQSTAIGSGKVMSNQQDFHQWMSHQSRDQFSLPPGYSVPPVQHGHQKYQPLGPYNGNSANSSVSQPYTFAPGFNPAAAVLRPSHPINNKGQPNIMINPVQLQTSQVANQFMPQLPPNPTYQQPIQANMVYQSAGLQSESNFANQQPRYGHGDNIRYNPQASNQPLGYPSRDHMATHAGFQQFSASQQNVLLNERQISYDSDRNLPMNFQNQPLSRDALNSESGNYLRDQRHDTPNHSQLSVVSRVNGKLITNPNLSTDDVEVDNLSGVLCEMSNEFTSSTSTLSKLKGSGRGKKHRTTNKERVYHVESDNTSDSDDCSSDDDCGAMIVKKMPVKKKVYNVVGCRIVQLGKGNKVNESGRKARHNHERSDMKEEGRKEVSEHPPSVEIKQVKTTEDNEKRISKDSTKDTKNESAEKDAMSLENKLSENLLSADVRKPTLNKSIVAEEESNLIHLGDSGNDNPRSQFNLLNSVVHSSGQQESEEKCSLQMNVFCNEQDGDLSSVEDNQYTSYTSTEELNVSDDQLFGDGSLSKEPQHKLQEYFYVLENERNDLVHEEFVTHETTRQANDILRKRPGQTMHEDKKPFFVSQAARQTNLFSVFSMFDNKYNRPPINVYSDSDEVD